MSGTDSARRERYLEDRGNDVPVLAAIALLSTMGAQPFMQAWDDALPAQPAITGLRFAKVDANELKPFSEPITATFPRIDANELKPFPSELELR